MSEDTLFTTTSPMDPAAPIYLVAKMEIPFDPGSDVDLRQQLIERFTILLDKIKIR